MKSIFILLFLTTCWNDIDETYCFECVSPTYPITTFCESTEEEMQDVIEWRKTYLNDTLTCTKL